MSQLSAKVEPGVDYLVVDEAHAQKDRRVDSSADGVAGVGSQQAQDLDAKPVGWTTLSEVLDQVLR